VGVGGGSLTTPYKPLRALRGLGFRKVAALSLCRGYDVVLEGLEAIYGALFKL